MSQIDPAEVERVARGLTKAPRQAAWLSQIADNGPDGLWNTPIPWGVLSALRRRGLCDAQFRHPHYYEIASPLGIAVRARLQEQGGQG